MKIDEIRKDMLDYIELRFNTDNGQSVNDDQVSIIYNIELKYKELLKDHRGLKIDYYGILNTNYESSDFEDLLSIIINVKESKID